MMNLVPDGLSRGGVKCQGGRGDASGSALQAAVFEASAAVSGEQGWRYACSVM